MKKILFTLFILLIVSFLFINKSKMKKQESYLSKYDTSDFLEGYKLQEKIYEAEKLGKNKIVIKNNYLITEPIHITSRMIIESESKLNPYILFFHNSGLLFNIKKQFVLSGIKIYSLNNRFFINGINNNLIIKHSFIFDENSVFKIHGIKKINLENNIIIKGIMTKKMESSFFSIDNSNNVDISNNIMISSDFVDNGLFLKDINQLKIKNNYINTKMQGNGSFFVLDNIKQANILNNKLFDENDKYRLFLLDYPSINADIEVDQEFELDGAIMISNYGSHIVKRNNQSNSKNLVINFNNEISFEINKKVVEKNKFDHFYLDEVFSCDFYRYLKNSTSILKKNDYFPYFCE